MKLLKRVEKKKKTLNEDMNKIPKTDIKVKLNSKSVENKKKRKCDLVEKKKGKSIKRLTNLNISNVIVEASKEKRKKITKGKINEKKNPTTVTNDEVKNNVQVLNIPKNSTNNIRIDKEESMKVKNIIQKTNKRRKALSNIEILKKSKHDSDIFAKQQQATIMKDITNVKNIRAKKSQRKMIKTEKKEDGDDINLKDLSKKHILQCISAIFHLTQEQLKNKNILFSEGSQPIFMQVTCIRIPKISRRQVRILLPYSIISSDEDIALFVCDLERGRRKDHEPTINHYRELLDKCGCTKIKDIIPINQVKTEYDQYELKRKLVASYDYFLVDGRIAGHISHLLGKIFYKKRKLPTSIKMNKEDLKCEIDYALRKTTMQLHSFADTHIIQVANTSMKKKQILENVLTVYNRLTEVYPGGLSNIRAIRLKTPTGPGLPIYITLKNKNTVHIPVIKPKRPKAYCNVEGELTTLSGDTNVIVTPDGNVVVKQTFSRESEDSHEEESVEETK
uniref:ribosomal L1 domain-containing protein CG13096-like n=1 Tax=Vespula vulgaris TaxID=7454 RepID=UPI002135770B|nr:ribosomal L1 domain-containing protein CG13096-like [Vespula vulgaris]